MKTISKLTKLIICTVACIALCLGTIVVSASADTTGKVLSLGNNKEMGVDLAEDIYDDNKSGLSVGFPYADFDYYYTYKIVFSANTGYPYMDVIVKGSNQEVSYRVNDGAYTEVGLEVAVEKRVFFEGTTDGADNTVEVKFAAKNKSIGDGAHIQKLTFGVADSLPGQPEIPDENVIRFGDGYKVNFDATTTTPYKDSGSGVTGAGGVRYVDGTNYFIYRVVIPEGTTAAQAIFVTLTGSGEDPAIGYKNVNSDEYIPAGLHSFQAQEQRVDISDALSEEGESVIDFKFSDPSTEDGNGTQLQRMEVSRNQITGVEVHFPQAPATEVGVNLVDQIYDKLNAEIAANGTPYADYMSYYTYKVNFPSYAIDVYVDLTVNGTNAYVAYSANGGEWKEIAVTHEVPVKAEIEGLEDGAEDNYILLKFAAKDVTTGNGASVQRLTVGFTDAETLIDGIALDTQTATMEVGEDLTLTATVTGGLRADMTVTWTSSEDTVATVDGGVVKAVAEGTVTITATSADGKTATCTITVKAAEVKDPDSSSDNDSSGTTSELPADSGSDSGSATQSGGCFGSATAASMLGVLLFAGVALIKKRR